MIAIIIVSSYILTLFIVGASVTLGVDKKVIDTFEIYCITVQVLVIILVLKKMKGLVYGRRR